MGSGPRINAETAFLRAVELSELAQRPNAP
jgi:hypothetical protein